MNRNPLLEGIFHYIWSMIAIVGGGNVATHLYKALSGHTEVRMVNPRTFEGMPESPEIVILAVSDNSIKDVASGVKLKDAILVHTSGTIPLSILKFISDKVGVLYPLQTFTKEKEMDYENIPVFIEGSSPEVVEKLKEVARMFSGNINEADSDKRKQLHLASVFACNFTNAMAGVAADILKEAGLDFSVILPLMEQTVEKLKTLSPSEAQTGPAVRGDTKVIESHLNMLEGKETLRNLYKEMTKIIQDAKI